jgi:cation diffusion facilitator CzcD-associated flavoprotein CzcO
MNVIDVAIIGAGPYGMSIAAHLRARGVSFRIFGEPMQFWREMPPAMFLKSNSSAADIYAPGNRLTFVKYSKDRGLEPVEPCAIADFARYGMPEIETIEVIHIAGSAEGFKIALSNSEELVAGRVVVATGLKAFARMPQELRGLPPELASHTGDHATFDDFNGKKVCVLGGGQSALQAAALLHEAGAFVEVLVRKSKINFSSRMAGRGSLFQRLRRPTSRLGIGLKSWVLDSFPGAVYFLPDRWRVPFVKSFLGPSVAWWLRERVTDKFPIHTNCSLLGANAREGRLALRIHEQNKGDYEVLCDHIVAGTGFKVDIDRLQFLDANLRQAIARVDGAPRLDGAFPEG